MRFINLKNLGTMFGKTITVALLSFFLSSYTVFAYGLKGSDEYSLNYDDSIGLSDYESRSPVRNPGKTEGNGDDDDDDDDDDSHNPGQDCIGCHSRPGNRGDAPNFTISGTVYTDSAGTSTVAGATVQLNSSSGAITMLSDTIGNFYTSQPFSGPYTATVQFGGVTMAMASQQTNLSCNVNTCHSSAGTTAGRIFVNPNATPTPTPGPGTPTIFGTVYTDYKGTTPLQGVTVNVNTSSGTITMVSDSQGYFSSTAPFSGTYTVTMSHGTSTVSMITKPISGDCGSCHSTSGSARAVVFITPGATTTSPTPDIKANGQDGSLSIATSDPLSVTVSLNSAGLTTAADWFVLVTTSGNQSYYYNLPTQTFQPGSAVTYTGSLFELGSYPVLSTFGLPIGSYTFTFYVDTVPDGAITSGSGVLFSDSVTVNVQ